MAELKNAILGLETQRDIVSASSCRLFGVPGFLSSILFLLLNPAAVIVVCWLYSLGQVLPVGSSGPITCGIHIRLLLGMKKAPCFQNRGPSASSSIQLSDRLIRRDHRVAVIRAERQLPGQELFDIESIFLVRIGSQEIVRVLRQIVFLRKERADAAQLQDALAAVKHRQLVNGQKIVAKLLIVQGVALLPSPDIFSCYYC